MHAFGRAVSRSLYRLQRDEATGPSMNTDYEAWVLDVASSPAGGSRE